jgi:hypothetical protein
MSVNLRIFYLALPLMASVACSGPLGPLPGGKLSGKEQTAAVTDWEFAADIEVVQLETNPLEPHSVNTWIGVVDKKLYIPSSLILGAEYPTEREWVNNVVADPNVRIRIADDIYPATLTRVEDQALAARVKQVMLDKYQEEHTEQVTNAWVFEAQSR